MTTSFSIPKAVLMPALATCAKVSDRRSALIGAKHLKITVEAGGVRLYASNVDTFYERLIPTDVSGEGVALVPTDGLKARVDQCGPGPIDFQIDGLDLRMKQGKLRYTVRGIDPGEAVSKPKGGGGTPTTVTIEAALFARLIERVLPVVENDPANPPRYCGRFSASTVMRHVELSNHFGPGFVGARAKMASLANLEPVYIPRPAMDRALELARTIAASGGEDGPATIDVVVAGPSIEFRTANGDTVFAAKTMVVPNAISIEDARKMSGGPHHLDVDSAALVTAIKATALVDPKGRVELTLAKGADLRVRAEDPDQGVAENEVEGSVYTGDPLRVAISDEPFLKILGCAHAAQVRVSLLPLKNTSMFVGGWVDDAVAVEDLEETDAAYPTFYGVVMPLPPPRLQVSDAPSGKKGKAS